MMAKRVMAWILAIVLTLNATPIVFAAEEEPPVDSGVYTAAVAEDELPDTAEKQMEHVEASEEVRREAAAAVLATASESRLDSFEQFLAYYYLTYSPLTYHMGNDELPYHTYVNNTDDDFEETLAAWKLSTMGASDMTTYSAKEVDFYLLLIYDVIYQKMHEDSLLKNFNTQADSIMAQTLLELADQAVEGAEALLPEVNIMDDNWEEILNTVVNTKTCGDLVDYSGTILKCVDYVGTVEDLFDKIAMMKAFIGCSDEINLILTDLHSTATDPLLKEALRQMRLMTTGLLTEEEIIMIFGGDIAVGEISGAALEALWSVVIKGNAVLEGLGIGQKIGKLASNFLCGTDAIVENWYSMEKVYTFEKVLKSRLTTYRTNYEKNPTYANAVKFNRAADMYLNTLSVGMDYAIKYVEAVKGGGIMGWIYKNILGKDYDGILASLKSIKSSIDLSVELSNNVPYNFYLDELEANSLIESSDWEETPCGTTEEEVEESVAELPEINFQLTDQTVGEDTTYSEDKQTYANYTLDGGTLDLAGQTLTVYGDFYLKGGTLNVNGGSLVVLGDLYMTGGDLYLHGGTIDVGGSATLAKVDEDGSYSKIAATSDVTMDNANDVFTIGGDLVTYLAGSSDFECSAGQLRIGGGWTNYNNSSTATMSGSGTFETVFTGTGDLVLNGVGAFYVPTMTIENASARNITLRGTVKAGTLRGGAMTMTASGTPVLSFASTTDDLVINGNVTLDGMNLFGNTLHITGDVLLQDDLTVGNAATELHGTVTIDGSLQMTGGELHLNNGSVNVGGSAILAMINEDGSYSRLGSSSEVTMDNGNDVFTIGGDLVTYLYSSNYFDCSAGQLRIGGGWTNYNNSSTATMSGSGTFETVFTGTGDLVINGDGAFYVPTMTIENAAARSITLRGTVKAGTLRGGAMTMTASGAPVLSFASTTDDLVINGNTQLAVATRAGGDITVNGNATLNGMTLFGNTLHITGDALLQGDLTVGNAATELHGTAAIDGSLQMTGGELHLNNGSVNVGGSATLARINEDGSYSKINSTDSVVMDNANDVLTIGGDLVTYLASSNYFECSAGQLRIGGGWTNYNSSSTATMSGSGTFETVFTGTGALEINGDGAFYVPTMTIENASARSITLQGTVKAGTLRGGAMTMTALGTPVLSFANTTGDLVINGDTQLAVATKAGGDITVNGDATLNSMTLFGNTLHITGDALLQDDLTVGNAATELHGTVTIDGSLQMTGGNLHPNNGSVNVGGSATLAKVNADGSYSKINMSSGVTMDNANDVFTIGGDLVTYLYSSGTFECSAGKLQIGGGWTNYNSSSTATMSGSGTFETVFTGTGALEINGDGAFYVPTMTIENAAARSITLQGTVKAGTLRGGAMTLTASGTPVLSFANTTDDLVINGDTQLAVATKAGGDITVNGNLYSNGLTMGANVLTVHKHLYLTTNNTLVLGPSGSLCVDGDVYMSKGEMSLAGTSTINGSFYQSAGIVKPNGGILTIRGDYRIQTADESTGELVWGNSSGRLNMVNSNDRVIVGGSFYTSSSSSHSGYLTAGTLYVCGDFVQNAGNSGNFKASGTHKVMLCGTRPQSATFASSGSKFHILQLTQDISQYTFNPDPCWTELQENVEIPDEVKCLNGHTWDNGTEQVAPGCLTEGVKRYTCTICGQAYTESIPALGHDYAASVTAPGCETQGYTTHTCIRCGDSYVDSYVEPVGHSYDSGRQTTAPGCEEAGVMTYTCTACGSTHIEAIEALGHDYAASVTAPGCETQGYTTHTCIRCGDSYVDGYVEALGHAWDDGVVTKAPTADEEGIRTYTCSRCAEKREERIPALGSGGHTHHYTVVVTAPTCALQGYSTYTCACGDSYTADYVDALGHAWNSGSVNSYPTCDVDGSVDYICTVCGTGKTEVVPAYGHSYDYEEIDPTCTEYGYILYTCDECDYSYRAEFVDPMWHYYVDGVCKRCEAALPELLASGTCGDQLTWTLTAEPDSWKAILTISGSGAMWDFDESLDDDPAPWIDLDLDVEITTIRIEDGCTSIGDYAFDSWTSNDIALETVILTDSITKIGKYAFSGHDDLDTIRLPEKLKTIEEGAFSKTGLLDVILPDSVTYLQLSAFEDCEDLTRAELSDSLTSIAEDAFRDCSSLVDVRIPESVTKIEADAFYHTALNRITLPDSVTRIGDRAFYACSDVEGVITIGKNVISIGAGAFASCSSLDGFRVDTSNLYYSSDSEGLLLSKAKGTLVQVPGDTYGVFEIPKGVTRIGSYAFAGSKITEIAIPDGVTGIGSDAFYYCTGLTKVTIPASVVSVGSLAFGSCSRLKEVTFLGSAPTFERNSWNEANAFSGVTAVVRYPADDETWTDVVKNQYGGVLTWVPVEAPKAVASGWSGATEWTLTSDGTLTVYGSGNMKNYGYAGGQPWLNKGVDITSVVIEEGVASVGSGAFMDLTTLKTVVLPDTLTKMGEAAFYGSGLKTVEIPASLWTIQPYTFKNCANLIEVIFNEGNLQKISDGAFYGTGLTELVLPDCLDILDVYAFKGCDKLVSITIGDSLTELREAVFYGTAIPTIVIPEGITKIGPYAFKNCVALETVDFPSTLTSVGEASFYADTALRVVELPDAVTAIGNYAFRKCAAIEELTLSAELVTIGECAFYGCTGLTELVIPDKVTTIKPYAFKTCEGLTSVTLGSSVKTIGEGAFNTCTGLKTIVFPASLTSIGDYCFSGSYNLWKLTFEGDAPAIGTGAFKGLNATAYYPGDNATWTSAVMQNYGGKLTWKAN